LCQSFRPTELAGDRVKIAGQARLYVQGTIEM